MPILGAGRDALKWKQTIRLPDRKKAKKGSLNADRAPFTGNLSKFSVVRALIGGSLFEDVGGFRLLHTLLFVLSPERQAKRGL